MAKNQLAFGLIGLGKFGTHYLRLLSSIKNVRLAATANRPKDNKNIFNDPAIDCVVIATPLHTHYAIAKDALRAGKHVLLEKPMVATEQEARSLAKEVKKSDRIFMVGHQYLYNDHIRHLKAGIDEGKLGAIRYVFAEQFSFAPRDKGDCFWEQATHELAIIDYLFGSPRIVRACGSAVGSLRARTRDFAAAEIRFSKNILATIAVSWYAPQKIRRMMIAGTKGLAFFDDYEETEKLRFRFGERVENARVRAREPLRNQIDHFIRCVRTGAKPLTDIHHGVRITKWLQQIDNALIHV